MRKGEKRGQVTIFIILGVLIVVLITLFVILKNPSGTANVETEAGIKETLQSCVSDAVEKKITISLENGGRLNSEKGIMYQGKHYNYLCHIGNYYSPCYNLFPIMEEDLEKDIRNSTLDDVRDCFDGLKGELEDRGFSVDGGSTNYSIDILLGRVDLTIRKKIQVTRDGASNYYENFDTSFISSSHELIRVVRDIVGSESTFCTFEYMGYMNLEPRLDIQRINYKESKLYWVKDRVSNQEIKFAIRTCVSPPGI